MDLCISEINKGRLKSALSVVFVFLLLCSNLCGASSSSSIIRQKRAYLVKTAKQYIGAPYKYGSSGPKSFDCSGFVSFLMRKCFYIKLPRSSPDIYAVCKKINKKDIEIGDLVFFSSGGASDIFHVGIYIGGNKFISALSTGSRKGVQVSVLNGSYWKSKYYAAGRVLPSGR